MAYGASEKVESSAVDAKGTEAGSGHVLPSERFSLSRNIPSRGFALVHEGRIAQTLWAAYLFTASFEGRPKICADTASILDHVYFEDSSRCGQLWPGDGADVPVRAFIRRDSTPNPFSRKTADTPELFGIFLLAPQVRKVEVGLAGGASFRLPTQRISSTEAARSDLPEARFAILSVRSERQIRSVVALGADETVLATGTYRRG